MRFKFMVVFVLSLMLISSLAVAKTAPQSRYTKAEAPDLDYRTSVFGGRAVFEGFEGAFPPAGWTHGITNTTNTWQQLSDSPYEGLYSAYIRWDEVSDQNETLEFTQFVDVTGGEYNLSFWMAGSIGYSWDLNASETVEINGTEVFDFDTSVTVGYMVYDRYDIDLSAYDGTTVTITFRYEGTDGDAHYIDAVMVDDGTGYVLPDISFCDLVQDAEGTGIFTGNTCDGQNLVYDLGCNYWTDNGLEHYYGVTVAPGGSFTATVIHESDTAAWILGNCSAPLGMYECLDHADDTYTGEAEVVSYTNDTGSVQVVYIVVDSWSTDSCGDYTLDFQGTDAVANEVMSLGEVKSLYR